MFYLVKTPWLIKKFVYPRYTWDLPTNNKTLYLTFDDGPHPTATPFVLDQLKAFDAKATFFCIGKNVKAHPEIYKSILYQGHSTGNHTHNHLNGWKVSDEEYFRNIKQASEFIDTNLFRPPYGRITGFQAQQVLDRMNYKIIMWSVLSGDFDRKLSNEACTNNVIRAAGAGSIVVFHDSEKAFSKLQYALPRVLKFFKEKGYNFDKIRI